ncbi:MAG: AAA family ATPase [bacterium]|nr:AAA family ATPase [bacterium]
MYLKQIKTYGFKSFADRITIDFSKNINGIVGPNGSGKSNIVDAVRWVLGEQSVKSLRGDSTMTDVIFAGSTSRKAVNNASVTLVFDNSDNYLPIDFSEVSIKRVVYRSGENEYFINNERCRLKDIVELMTDTNAGKESFNIISQGKISEILSNKPLERRGVFEEASGVLKYKKKKEEALRKLDKTNDNILRINDITIELEKSLTPLKEQYEKATTYLEKKDILKDVEISLIVHDIDTIKYEQENSLKEKLKLNESIVKLTSSTSNSLIDIDKIKKDIKQLETSITTNQNDLLYQIDVVQDIKTQMKLFEVRNKDIDKDKLIVLKNKKILLNEELNKLNITINDIRENIEELDKLIVKLAKEYGTSLNNYNIFNTKLTDSKRKLLDLEYSIKKVREQLDDNGSLPSAVQNILNNSNLTGIHNVVGNLLEIKDEYKLAISIALAMSTNNLVVDTSEVAISCVNYLKKNKIGRCTFLPLDVIKSRYIDENIQRLIKDDNDYIDIACNLVSSNSIYQNIVNNLLGCTIVVATIEGAKRISKIIKSRYKIVSLDGQVVNVGGSITGGSINNRNSSIILEKRKLQELEKSYNNLLEEIEDNTKILEELQQEKIILEKKQVDKKMIRQIEDNNLQEQILKKEQLENKLNSLMLEINSYDNNGNIMEDKLFESYLLENNKKSLIEKTIEDLKKQKDNKTELLSSLEDNNRASNLELNKLNRQYYNLEVKINRYDVKLDNLLLTLTSDYCMTYDNARLKYFLEYEQSIAREKVISLKQEIDSLGMVNLGAIDEYNRINERYTFLVKQRESLLTAKDTLYEVIDEMDNIMKEKFLQTFNEINIQFKQVFRDLFKGGSAELKLTDANNILETGIDIIAIPPGKKFTSLSVLSGGEMTFTAISLLFAIMNVKQVPFCILDEVEAALDEVNVASFGEYLSRYKDKTQFIIITHKKKTMEYVDVLYGITMQESGISKLVSVKLENVE